MKKLNILQKFILIFCSVFFFVGCIDNIGETNNIDEGVGLKSENLVLSNYGRQFSNDDIQMLGDFHNEFLSKIYSQYNYDSDNHFEEFKINFYKYQDNYSVNFDTLNYYSEVDSMLSILKENLSDKAFNVVISLIENSINIKSYSDFEIFIKNKQLYITENFNSAEADILLSICSVISSSAYFWLPEENGGSGEGFNIIEKFNEIGGIDYSNTKKITLLDYTKTAKSSNNTLIQAVGNALVADGLSAGVGMIAVAVAGILGGPLGWTALAITFGESVISSGIAAFFNYRRNRNSPEIIANP